MDWKAGPGHTLLRTWQAGRVPVLCETQSDEGGKKGTAKTSANISLYQELFSLPQTLEVRLSGPVNYLGRRIN